ncbi:MAG TPA: hypothetical protein VD863_28085, partial [Bradyrhizobium sp.]|nr:hypothetical protein [Bradyrhizobium sp.]
QRKHPDSSLRSALIDFFSLLQLPSAARKSIRYVSFTTEGPARNVSDRTSRVKSALVDFAPARPHRRYQLSSIAQDNYPGNHQWRIVK